MLARKELASTLQESEKRKMIATIIIITSLIASVMINDAIDNYKLCKRYERLEKEIEELENARFEALEQLLF